MSEEKNALEEVVAAIQKLLGFGSTEDITGAVNGILGAEGDENKIVTALKDLFGKAIGPEILTGVVKGFLSDGNGIDLGNILQLFPGIGDKIGGFDTIASNVSSKSGASKSPSRNSTRSERPRLSAFSFAIERASGEISVATTDDSGR